MNRRRVTSAHSLTAVLFALVAGTAGPARGADAAASAPYDERARIASERAEVEARFSDRERECRTRFIVTSCVDDAKAERRQALDKLRVRQLAVDEERRRERTAQRQAELAEKAAEDARRDRERAAHAAASAASGAALPGAGGHPLELRTVTRGAAAASSASGAVAHPSDAGQGAKPHVVESAAVRQEREASSRAAFEARQREAAEHREEALQRTERRMAAKPPAAPLPVPAAASTAPRP